RALVNPRAASASPAGARLFAAPRAADALAGSRPMEATMKRPALEHGLEELFVLAREAGKPSAEEHARLARELSALQVATGPLTLREPSAIEGLERPSVD